MRQLVEVNGEQSTGQDGVRPLLERLAKSQNRLTTAQRKVADVLAQDPRWVAFMSSEELAAAAGVSDTTVVRLTLRLGYRGYGDMQRALRQGLVSALLPADLFRRRLQPKSSVADPIRIMEADEASLRATRETLPGEVVRAAAARIVRARRVGVIGARTAYAIAYFLAFRLREVREGVQLLGMLPGTLDEEVRLLGQTDVLVVVSMARYAAGMINSARVAQQQGVYVIGVTDSAVSPLRPWCSTVLEVKADDISAAVVAGISVSEALVYAAARVDRRRWRRRLAEIEAALEDAGTYHKRGWGKE